MQHDLQSVQQNKGIDGFISHCTGIKRTVAKVTADITFSQEDELIIQTYNIVS